MVFFARSKQGVYTPGISPWPQTAIKFANHARMSRLRRHGSRHEEKLGYIYLEDDTASVVSQESMPSIAETRKRGKTNKNVAFHVVEIRVYEASISHNPSVRDGVAVELGWNYTQKSSMGLNEFEASRADHIRTKKELMLDAFERINLLRDSGYTMSEIQKAIQATTKARSLRMQTLQKVRAEDRKNDVMRRVQLRGNLKVRKRKISTSMIMTSEHA